ncbi:MAG: sulfotransferase [Pseudomonadota bacterium]
MANSQNQFALTLARRASRFYPRFFAQKLCEPVFIVGFNNSGKSSAVRALGHLTDLNVYPGEGNAELWFRGHFPWISSSAPVAPIWVAPDEFIRSVKDTNGQTFERARSQLGAYQWLTGGRNLLNDSGMLAALAPDIAQTFPDGKFIHFIRDGRLASYITARLEWSKIIRSPGKYIEFNCPIRFRDVLRKMAQYWVWTIQRMDLLAETLPGSVLELRYEDWWQNPEPMVNAVGDFLQLSPAPPSELPEAKGDLTRHLLSEMSEDERLILDEVLLPTLLQKGYEIERNEFGVTQMPARRP